MERDYELVSGTPAVMHNESGEGESRDAFLRLMEAGLDADSEQGASQYSPEQSLASERGRANTHGFEAFENFNFQNALRHAALDRTVSLPDLPWETAAWSFIFNDDHNMLSFVDPAGSFADPPMPALPGGADEVLGELVERKKRSRQIDPAESNFSRVIGHKQDVAWEEKREADLQKSLMKWLGVIRVWPDEWAVCKELSECETIEASCELVSHYFSGKAPATLVKRANSMIFILEQGHKLGYFFPYTEREFYNLLKTLKAAGFKSSRLKGVLEACTLCRYAFNIESLHDLTNSRRCLGAIAMAPMEKANQAAPLKVSEVQMLHDALESSQDIWDRVAAGAFLFCIYSRARWSDFIHGHSIELDTLEDGDIAYAEMHVSVHKTMFASARRFRFLNLVAPGRGIHGGDWVRCWMDSLRAVGINPYDPEHGCLMPAPDSYGHPLKRAVETEEAGAWLRLLIGEHVNKAESTRPVSSHSLKSTMLSFASKRGISHQDRLSLGHHSHPFKMADVYARDAQARDLRLMDKLIAEIRSGYFCPDESRAGRFHESKRLKVDATAQVETELASTVGEPDDDQKWALLEDGYDPSVVPDRQAEVEDDHVTTCSSSSSESEVEREVVVRQFAPPTAPAGYTFVKHSKSKLLHYVEDGMLRVLACGRMKSDMYIDPGVLRYDSAVCHSCQRAAGKDRSVRGL